MMQASSFGVSVGSQTNVSTATSDTSPAASAGEPLASLLALLDGGRAKTTPASSDIPAVDPRLLPALAFPLELPEELAAEDAPPPHWHKTRAKKTATSSRTQGKRGP